MFNIGKKIYFLTFLSLLYVYARSEGERFPMFLFTTFALIVLFETAAIVWLRKQSHLQWSLPQKTGEAFSPFSIQFALKIPRLALGTIRIHADWPYRFTTENALDFLIIPSSHHSDEIQRIQCTLGPRGCYALGPFEASFEDPLGVFTVKTRLWPTTEVLVTPKLLPLDCKEWLQGIQSNDGSFAFDGQPSSSPRAYHYGDPLKRIHWKATAHFQTLMIRELENHEETPTLIWLDLSRHSYYKNELRLETAISLAATLLTYFYKEKQPVRFIITGWETRSYSLPSDDFDALLRDLSLAYADGVEPIEYALKTLPLSGHLILITAQLTQSLISSLEIQSQSTGQTLILLAGCQSVSHDGSFSSRVKVRCYQSA